MSQFCRLDLRTTDADAARAFYRRILGHERVVIWPLHEQALARGARPHWLGQLGVEDVEQAAAAFIERGATRLGPTRPTADGGRVAVLRDPGGAIMGLATAPAADARDDIGAAWQVLHTNDAARATADYCELFGWALTERVDLGQDGAMHPFAWGPGGASVGAIAGIAERPGVHPHWLFFFGVDDLELAITATRAAGGLALEPIVMPSGQRFCACDDPQGAAFGLCESPRLSSRGGA